MGGRLLSVFSVIVMTIEMPISATALEDYTAITCPCGRVNRVTQISPHIATEENEYPWQVAFIWDASSTTGFCGGSIINDAWVLTSATCATVMSPSNVVVVGQHSWSHDAPTTHKVAIEQIHMKPNYNDETIENDVALIKLTTPLAFDNSNKVAPICPPDPTDPYEHLTAIATGWGTLSTGGSQSDFLQEVEVATMTNTECQLGYGAAITGSMICAKPPYGGPDFCQGNTGGPLITADGSLFRQIGVASWGYGCGIPEYPGVYARVNSQLEWIKSTISGTSWCEPGQKELTLGHVK